MAKFFQITRDEVDMLRDSDLTKNELLAFLYLRSIEAFGDNYRPMPTKRELAEYLHVSIATVRRILKKLNHLKLFVFDVRSRFKSVFKNIKVAGSKARAKFFCPDQDCNNSIKDDRLRSKLQPNDQDCKNQQLELLPDNDSDFIQTIQTDHTPQTGEKVDEKINEKQEVSEGKNKQELEKKDIKYSVLPNHREKKKVPPNVTQKKYDIPKELLEKLRMLEVKTSEEVLVQISKHHISQAYSAIAHVENTFETIRDKTAVFLYQLPKQPIERLGQRYDDELLEKQKQEVERIDKEKTDPNYFQEAERAFERIKQIFERNPANKKGRD